MPAKNPWQHNVVLLNNKGLDLIHPIEQVDAEHYSRMDDVKSLQEGTLTPRPGTSLINSSAITSPSQPIQLGQADRGVGFGATGFSHSFPSPTYAFVANRLYLLSFFMERTSGTPAANVTSITAGGGTWVEVKTQDFATISTPDSSVAIFRTMLSSASTTGIAWTTDQAVGSFATISEFTGMDLGGTNGSAAIVQNSATSNDSASSMTTTLNSFGSANNSTWVSAAIGVGSDVFTATSPMVIVHNGGGSGATIGGLTMFFDGTDLTPAATWSPNTLESAIIALELKAA